MRKLMESALALSLVVALAPMDAADAKTRHWRHHHYAGGYYRAESRPPLVVQRRSFLDPGTQVPVGSYNQYARHPAYERGDPVGTNQRGWYMDEILHPTFGPNPQTGGFGGYYGY
jgi:hypothetical protein